MPGLALPARGRAHAAGQGDHELDALARAYEIERPAVALHDDVVADGEAEPGALARRFGGEERREDAVPDLGGDAAGVVAGPDLHPIAGGSGLGPWLAGPAPALLPLAP